MTVRVPVRVLPHAADLPLPGYATAHAAGLDLLAAVDADVLLAPMQRAVIPTGLCVAIPEGWEAQVRPRSGLARNHGVTCLNTPGTIDADYRGEIGVLLVNLGAEPFAVSRGMRIAQLVVSPVGRIEWEPATELPPTVRGAGGFGSTGVA